jgi:fido (protein-threonine AMPylation protein)
MWVPTAQGNALVPDDIGFDAIADLSDERFALCLAALENLRKALEENNEQVFLDLLFQREAQCFSPRFKGPTAGDAAYASEPFRPFYIFDSRAALDYANAADALWRRKRSTPYSISSLLSVHKMLLNDHPQGGRLRDIPAWLGVRDTPIKDATTVLAPPAYLRPCLKKMATSVALLPSSHRIAACAMIHYQITAIHPFVDGNGRLVRLVTAALLQHFKLVEGPSLFVSEVLKARNSEYAARLHSLDWYGEIEAWVLFFADALREQARHSADLVKLASRVRGELLSVLSGRVGSGARATTIADDVLLSSSVPVSRCAKILKCSRDEADRLLQSLSGWFGLSQAVDSDDPVYQFGDLYELFAV